MKNKFINSVLVFITTFLLSSCAKDVLRGEGSIITETRSLADFAAVEISGNRHAEIVYSTESKVEITGYQNLVTACTSTVSNGKLHFDYHHLFRVKNDNITVKIYTPSLSSINMSGNTEVNISENFSGNYFDALLSGNGILRMRGGLYNTVSVNTSGSAKVFASTMEAANGKVVVSGNGYVELRATKKLDVRISGNAEVHYWGSPVLLSSISGNGKIIHH